MSKRALIVWAGLCLSLTACDSDAPGEDANVDSAVDDTGVVDTGSRADAREDSAVGDAMDSATPPSPGCVDGAGISEGENTFELDGRTRRFLIYLPNEYTRERAWPLLFALHGNGGSADYWDNTSGERNIRGEVEDDAVLIIAEAIEGNWRDYAADRSTWPGRIEEELRYFDELVMRTTNELCIDQDAIFSMGFSGGGSFSGVLGCRREYIRAFGAGGAVIYFDETACVQSPAAWIAISEDDLSDGRRAFRDFFRDAAGCVSSSTPTDPSGCEAYDGCDAESPVHYCAYRGGHRWPAMFGSVSGTEAVWSFFSGVSR